MRRKSAPPSPPADRFPFRFLPHPAIPIANDIEQGPRIDMPEAADDIILKLLREKDLLTASQETRIRAALKRGMNLADAIAKTPLVDPVKFASIATLARRGPVVTELAQEPAHMTDTAVPTDLDELDLPTEIAPAGTPPDDDLDLDLDHGPEPVPPAATARKNEEDDIDTMRFLLKPKAPKIEQQEVGSLIEEAFDSPKPAPAAAQKSKPDLKLTPLKQKEEYTGAGAKPHNYNLADDEGITLISEVNAILSRCLEHGGIGFVMETSLPADNLRLYGLDGSLKEEQTLESALLEKVINRMKVMARIETWRRLDNSRGVFRATWKASSAMFYVHGETMSSGERLTVHLERE